MNYVKTQNVVDNKRYLGQFFTKYNVWLKPHILKFIINSNCDVIYDPFAGKGDILNVMTQLGFNKIVGLDIDAQMGWKYNDSLINIPKIENSIIITNPPYLANFSAKRKHIYNEVEKYFDSTMYDNLYMLALDKMLEASNNVVAIIPESFINSNYKNKNLLKSITILEDSPFDDTDNPVIVACFDGVKKSFSEIKVYKNDEYINDLRSLDMLRLTPTKNITLNFNDKNGWLAIRCIDNVKNGEYIKFGLKSDFNYNWNENIKKSSRLLTLVDVNINKIYYKNLIDECNLILNHLRNDTKDVILTPFKGNTKLGERRRRLDFKTCRAIIEMAYTRITKEV